MHSITSGGTGEQSARESYSYPVFELGHVHLLSEPLLQSPSLCREAVFLQAAARLVRDGHFYNTDCQRGLEVGITEVLFPVLPGFRCGSSPPSGLQQPCDFGGDFGGCAFPLCFRPPDHDCRPHRRADRCMAIRAGHAECRCPGHGRAGSVRHARSGSGCGGWFCPVGWPRRSDCRAGDRG